MVNRPKNIGTAAETAVVRAARTRGFPHADRLTLTGNKDRGDIRLTPGLTAGVIVEVKGGQAARTASDTQIATWLTETERERLNAGADIAFLVTTRPGIGPANAHRWWAHLTAAQFIHLLGAPTPPTQPNAILRLTLADVLACLRGAGYGEPIDPNGAVA